jgi:hypothetical protein
MPFTASVVQSIGLRNVLVEEQTLLSSPIAAMLGRSFLTLYHHHRLPFALFFKNKPPKPAISAATFGNIIAASPSPPSDPTTPPFTLTAVALGHGKWDTKYITLQELFSPVVPPRCCREPSTKLSPITTDDPDSGIKPSFHILGSHRSDLHIVLYHLSPVAPDFC